MDNKKTPETKKQGIIKQVIGAVVDIYFEGDLPEIYTALETQVNNEKLILEVQQHIGSNLVRAIAMSSTDGLKRDQEVLNTGEKISVPVGEKTLGRIFDVLGNAIDGKENPETEKRYPIHRSAPEFKEQSTKIEVLETGIKVIDLICPIVKGWFVWRCRGWKNRFNSRIY